MEAIYYMSSDEAQLLGLASAIVIAAIAAIIWATLEIVFSPHAIRRREYRRRDKARARRHAKRMQARRLRTRGYILN